MANVKLIAGLVLIGFGLLTFTNIIPLAVTASSASTTCVQSQTSAWSCTTTAQITNTGTAGFTPPFTAFFVYKDSRGAIALVDSVQWNPGQTSVSDIVTNSIESADFNCPCNGFTVNIFFQDAVGNAMGQPLSTSFGVPIPFYIYYAGVGSVTINPAGFGVKTCVSSCPNGNSYYFAYWQDGQTITATTTAGVAPVTWANNANDVCPAASSGPGFVCTFNVSGSYSAFISGASGGGVQSNSILVFSDTAGPQVTPNEICLSAVTYTYQGVSCGPSESFAITQYAPWSVVQQNTLAALNPPVAGAGTTAMLSFAQLQNQVSFSQGLAALEFVVSAPASLTILQPTIGTITPAPGTYICTPTSQVCQPGMSASISISIPANAQLLGWTVNGQTEPATNPLSVPIPQSGLVSVDASVAACPSTGCTPPPPPPPSPGSGGIGQIIGVVSALGGAGLVFLGLKRRR